MNKDFSYCPGKYIDQQQHPQCVECKRLLTGYPAGYWYIAVPVFEDECPVRVEVANG